MNPLTENEFVGKKLPVVMKLLLCRNETLRKVILFIRGQSYDIFQKYCCTAARPQKVKVNVKVI